jgi:hypothetical protein
MAKSGCEITVHGDGLLKAIANAMVAEGQKTKESP